MREGGVEGMRRSGTWLAVLLGLAVGLGFGPALGLSLRERGRALREDFLPPVVRLAVAMEERYVEELDFDKLRVGAYKGMLSRLDKHSSYIPPVAYKEFRGEIEGEFGGLGIRISYNAAKKAVQIEETLPRTPASKTGLLPGDLIVEIREGQELIKTADFDSVHDAVEVLRGKVGADVTITVVRANGGDREQITITRDVITLSSVEIVRLIDGEPKLGYVKLAYFSKNAARELQKAVEYLRGQGIEGLILDLRFNPGGLLETARDCAGLFLDGEIIVSTKDRNGSISLLYAHGETGGEKPPMVVLINRFSASGAEIVGAALHDHQKAILVGETTYGKASVQKVIEYPGDEEGAVKLTIAHYYTPNEVLIEGKGIKPDMEVKLSDDDTRELFRHLNSQVQYDPIPREGDEPEPAEPPEPEQETPAGGDAEEEEVEEFVDVQLGRAVEVLAQAVAEARAPASASVAEGQAATQG